MWQALLGLLAVVPFLAKDSKRSKTVVKEDGSRITAEIQPDGAKTIKKEAFINGEKKTVVAWAPPPEATQYLQLIADTEKKYAIPDRLLARLLYQESRYRPDVVSGKLKSSAGAVGIAQIVPRWHPGVDPVKPKEAIPYAGKYLRDLYNMFRSWDTALKAYNWGPGNVKSWLDKGADITKLPKETLAYSTEILRDVPAYA